jgi:hypothetical protein
MGGKEKSVLPKGQTDGNTSSSADLLAGFGTLLSQVAGLHRAGPSATLDKAIQL